MKVCSCFPEDLYKVFSVRGSSGQRQNDSNSNDNDGLTFKQSRERKKIYDILTSIVDEQMMGQPLILSDQTN